MANMESAKTAERKLTKKDYWPALKQKPALGMGKRIKINLETKKRDDFKARRGNIASVLS